MPTLSFASPLGKLTLCEEGGSLTELTWAAAATEASDRTDLLLLARNQIREYFDGDRTEFSLPLAPAGSDFQQRVWRAMLAIPFGETRTYGDLARELSSAPRAVGRACGANPIPLIVPCHRVIAAGGKPGGYSGAGGVATKAYLLALENRPAQQALALDDPPCGS